MSDLLQKVFASVLDVPMESLNEETSPDNTEQWDSLAAMHLVSAIEDAFTVSLGTRDIMRMTSIGIARDVLRAKGVDV